jgi:hypothetical protein
MKHLTNRTPRFVVETHFLENYGGHSEDGKFASGNAYWKFKPGSAFLVDGLDRPQDAMAFVASLLRVDSLYSKEFPASVVTEMEYYSELDELTEEHREFLLTQLVKVNPTLPIPMHLTNSESF